MRSSPRVIRSRRSCRSISPRHRADDFGNVAGAIRSQLGRLDGLVHTAAFLGSLGPIEHQSFDAWQKVLRVNLAAAMAMTRSTLPLLSAAPDACVVFTLDTRGENPRAYWGAYGAAKSGLSTLATILADEWENRPNLRVNAVVPGPIRSPLRALTHPGEDRSTLPAPEAIVPLYLHLLGAQTKAESGVRVDAEAWRGGQRGVVLARRIGGSRPAIAKGHAQAPRFFRRQHVGEDDDRRRGTPPWHSVGLPDDGRQPCADEGVVEYRPGMRAAVEGRHGEPAIDADVNEGRNAATGAAPKPLHQHDENDHCARQEQHHRQRQRGEEDRRHRARYRNRGATDPRRAWSKTKTLRRLHRSLNAAAEPAAIRQATDQTFFPASMSQVATAVSGFSEMLSIPCATSHCARSG